MNDYESCFSLSLLLSLITIKRNVAVFCLMVGIGKSRLDWIVRYKAILLVVCHCALYRCNGMIGI